MLGARLTNLLRLRRYFFPRDRAAASRSASRGGPAEAGVGRESETVEVRGVFVGVAAPHALGFQFVAADPSVLDMGESVWPTLEDLRNAVAQRRRAFLRARGRPSPWLHSRRSGAALAKDHHRGLTDDIRHTLDNFDW